jgi:alanine racemase
MSIDETDAPAETSYTHGPPEAEAGGVLTIDLAAIESNWRRLRSVATPSECGAVIKGDGYGCGLEPVAAQLYQAGCTTFFVADLSEGRRTRVIAPEATIFILNGLTPGSGPVFAEHYMQPVIGSSAELAEWDMFCRSSGWHGGFALHVDTGMNRLGVTIEEAVAISPRLSSANHGITLLMSHFISSEIPDNPRNHEQVTNFREIRRLFRGIPASLANSSGIYLGRAALCDVVRPGVALFGLNPTPGKPNPMRRVVELKARILVLRRVEIGQTVGYNATWTAKRVTRLAIVGVGYADGYLRSGSGGDNKPGGAAIVSGIKCPIVGRISMDMKAIDITDLPPNSCKRGDLVTLIGEGLELDEVAERAGTIGYEILTDLGHRYHRIYKSDESA